MIFRTIQTKNVSVLLLFLLFCISSCSKYERVNPSDRGNPNANIGFMSFDSFVLNVDKKSGNVDTHNNLVNAGEHLTFGVSVLCLSSSITGMRATITTRNPNVLNLKSVGAKAGDPCILTFDQVDSGTTVLSYSNGEFDLSFNAKANERLLFDIYITDDQKHITKDTFSILVHPYKPN
jgi:hypothetical protein